MKTQITEIFRPREDYSIFRVLILDDGTISILNWKYKESSILDLYRNGQIIKSIKLEDFPGLDKGNYYQCMIKYKKGFGFLNRTNKFIYWEDIDSAPISIDISNPFPPDKHNRVYHPKFGYYDKNSNELWFGLEEPSRYGFPARYLCKLQIDEKRNLGIGKMKLKANWGELIELPLDTFPETINGKYPESEWLSINTFRCKNYNLIAHSIGGGVTRLKSGPNFEFSVLGIINTKNLSTKIYTVEEGHGLFAENSDYFILHPRLKKHKLYFYDIEGQEIKFDISLTSKQNLGDEKKNYLLFDFDGNFLYLYNTKFLHVCKVIDN